MNISPTASLQFPDFVDARTVRHIGYVVDSIPEAVAFLSRTFGAGPFYSPGRITLDEVVGPDGEPAIFDHTNAFGRWGDIVVELQEMHQVEPPALREKLCRSFNHVAILAEDPQAESERLSELGLPLLVHCIDGPVEVTFHDVPALGFAIEIHKDTDFIRNAHEQILKAAEGWDGTEPLRDMSALPGFGAYFED